MLSLFITSTSTVEKEKSPLLFAGRIINGDLPALPPLEKNQKKFNAISAHDLKSYRRSQVGLSNIHSSKTLII